MNGAEPLTPDAVFAGLGLRPDADARAVRKAYAAQLKSIDQTNDLHGFQALREGYELALHLVAQRAAAAQVSGDTPPTDTAPPPSATQATLPDSAQQARLLFEAFEAKAGPGFASEDDATAALAAALADDQLLNLEARTIFEFNVGRLLVLGWRPGHEFLFGPACQAFHWETDRAHLRVFGELGAILNAAIDERMVFFSQERPTFEQQRQLIRRLRDETPPTRTLLREDLPLLHLLVQRYPNWLRIVTSQNNINAWFGRANENAEAAPESQPAPQRAVGRSEGSLQKGWKSGGGLQPWWLLAIVVLVVLRMVGGGNDRSSGYRPPSSTSAPNLGSGVNGAPPAWQSTTLPTWGSTPSPGDGSILGRSNVDKPLYPDLPRPSPAPSYQPEGEDAKFFFLGNVTFVLNGVQVTVDEVDAKSVRGRSTLQPGDQLEGCPVMDRRMGFIFTLESTACGATKSVDAKTGVVVYVFRVLRRSQGVSAALVLPPPQGLTHTAVNAATLEEALKAAAVLPTPPTPTPTSVSRPSLEADVQMGHVTFRRQASVVVVAQVGKRTRHSFGTLQPGDMVLACVSSDYRMPLIYPSEVRHCVVSNPPPKDASTTAYMFRVLRNGQSQPASLTLRSIGDETDSSPDPSP